MTEKRLTIGMATYDDFDGTYFTLQNIRLGHQTILDDLTFIIVDNYPESGASERLRFLSETVPDVIYIPFAEWTGSAAPKDLIFRLARTPYVMCVDSHVLIEAGAINRLLDYLSSHPQCDDLLQGPLLDDGLLASYDHMEPGWQDAMFGFWASDPHARDVNGSPYAIPMQGMGLFACRREAWLGFNPRMMGFGGEEGYIHEKYRRAGHRTLCLPFLRWMHRFNQVGYISYNTFIRDRVLNYLIGYRELDMDDTLLRSYFRQRYGIDEFARLYDDINAELDSPFLYFDAIYWLSINENQEQVDALRHVVNQLGFEHRVRLIRTDDIETTRQDILKRTWVYGFETVFVFTDDAMFLENTHKNLASALNGFEESNSDTLQLSASETFSEAIVYKRTAFLNPQRETLITETASPPITISRSQAPL